ncbi:hypothetical protein Mnod_8201 (plasmid) [Methylobacterium nodulans ORS 2060]|uniref:Uncharacterized protein n=1 Tax=Methylobacterium nodulans (strain LMG 21967 / CNCM I-2342 / ORS 2060) TaxID=460265 RepID=B8IXD4_METNO|nr:hypothetical protein Mnod_8201 [Methylobacterium nodulans ORS 2060]
MEFRIPKPISAQAHRRFDMLAFPGLLALTAWRAALC